MGEDFKYGIEIKTENISTIVEDEEAENTFEDYLSTDGEVFDFPE